MAVNPISSGSPHVRPMGRTCGEPDEIKKNTHPKKFTALFREQDVLGEMEVLGVKNSFADAEPEFGYVRTCSLQK